MYGIENNSFTIIEIKNIHIYKSFLKFIKELRTEADRKKIYVLDFRE